MGFFFPDFSDKVGLPGLPPGPVFGLRERVGLPGPPAGLAWGGRVTPDGVGGLGGAGGANSSSD
jgi:hypothetical protein